MYQLRPVHNISSPFRHNRKPLIFQWALTIRNAGIGSGSNPAFRPIEKLMASGCDETETIYCEPAFRVHVIHSINTYWTEVITHTEMTRLSQPCDKVVTTMSTIDKVVTTLWIGCQQLTRL